MSQHQNNLENHFLVNLADRIEETYAAYNEQVSDIDETLAAIIEYDQMAHGGFKVPRHMVDWSDERIARAVEPLVSTEVPR